MKALLALKRSKQKNLLILFTAGLLFWSSMTSLLPVLPAYIEDVGATTQQVGLVMGSFAIGLLLSRTWLGELADRHSRKIAISIGTVVAAIAPIGYLFVESIPVLMILRAFHGISIAALTTGYSALVVDLSPREQKGEIIGYMSLAVPIGMAIGPALGGYLQGTVGYATLFKVSATLGLLAFICAFFVKEKSRQQMLLKQKDSASGTSRNFWELLKSPSLFVPAIIFLQMGLLFGTLSTFLPLFVREIGVDLNVGLFYTAAGIASFSVRVFSGKASDTIGRGLFITASIVCYGLSMIVLAWATHPSLFLLSAVFEGAGAGLLFPMIIALMSDRSYASERGKVFSLGIGGFDLGIAIAGPIFGSLAFTLSYPAMFLLAAGLAVLALIIFITQSNKKLTYSFRFAFGQEKDMYALHRL